MRLFIALNLPEDERRRIHEGAAALRGEGLPVRWVEPEHYHLTLKFLGDVPAAKVPAVEAALQRVASGTAPFAVEVGGFGAFPTVRRPRVLWIAVEPSPALRCLKQDLEWALVDSGFDRETRAFHPHLTLGRAAGQDGAGAFRGLDQVVAGLEYRGSFQVATVDLMKSHLSRQGPRYTILRTSQLGRS